MGLVVQSLMLTADTSGQSGCTVHGLSAMFPCLNCGFVSALCSTMLAQAHCEEPGLVNFHIHVCPGRITNALILVEPMLMKNILQPTKELC